MKVLLLLCLSLSQFYVGYSLPSLSLYNDEATPNEYLHAKPYTREEILEVKKQLNLSWTPDPDEYLSVVSDYKRTSPNESRT